jgi:hypothetical protein
MSVIRALAVAAALLAVTNVTATADTCQLTRVASIDITVTSGGAVLVPVAIKGQPEYMVLAMDTAHSALLKTSADTLALDQTFTPHRIKVTYFGSVTDRVATASGFDLGGVKGDIDMLAVRDLQSFDPRAAGVLGLDVMRNFDVELDIAGGKLNLFSQDHCPGKVIYWTHAPSAALPMDMAKLGNYTVPMQMDGQKLRVSFNTTRPESLMSMDVAHEFFELTEIAAGVLPAIPAKIDGSTARKYTFKALSADGIVVSNPEILLVGDYDSSQERCNTDPQAHANHACYGGEADLQLGVNLQRKLHFFYDFSEKMIYFTAAGAPPAKP